MAAVSGSSLQIINHLRVWIWKKKIFNLISQQQDIDKIYLYTKDPYEAKCQLLINKKKYRFKHLNDSKAFTECSDDMDNIYRNNEECNSGKERKIFIVFNDMMADIISNKKLNPTVTILVFIEQSYFDVPKNVRLNSISYFIIEIPNNRQPKQIALNHSPDTGFKDFINLYKKCAAKPYFFLVIDTTTASDNPSLFRQNLLERI